MILISDSAACCPVRSYLFNKLNAALAVQVFWHYSNNVFWLLPGLKGTDLAIGTAATVFAELLWGNYRLRDKCWNSCEQKWQWHCKVMRSGLHCWISRETQALQKSKQCFCWIAGELSSKHELETFLFQQNALRTWWWWCEQKCFMRLFAVVVLRSAFLTPRKVENKLLKPL